jgi:outer membrane beta-barrel protein
VSARLAALLLAATPVAALAQRASEADIENPGQVFAVQERAHRLNHELSFGVGILPLDAVYKGLTLQLGYTFHFSDSLAWQVGRGLYSYNLKTGLRNQLERDFGVLPTQFQEVQFMVGSDLIWSPFYSKTAVGNRRVIYGESYFIAGGSVLRLKNLSGGAAVPLRPALNLGIGFRLFKNDHVSFRLDVTDNIVITDRPFNVLSIQLLGALNFGATE